MEHNKKERANHKNSKKSKESKKTKVLSSKQKSKKSEKERRSKKITFRTTPANYKTIHDKAKSCGTTISSYMEQLGMNHKPRLHLTEQECQAFNSISDARSDLIKISNALRGKTYEQKLRYFNNEGFMKMWISSVTRIIQRWDDIERNLLN